MITSAYVGTGEEGHLLGCLPAVESQGTAGVYGPSYMPISVQYVADQALRACGRGAQLTYDTQAVI